MGFANREMMYLVVLPLLMILFYVWALKRRRSLMKHFLQKDLIKELTQSVDERKRFLKSVLLVLGLSFAVFSLLRPTWGYHWEEVKRKGLDIIVAIDTSKSMLAEDIKPNRLKRTKLAVKDLVAKLKGDRIGLVAFAGTAFLQCPLTVDYNGFMLALDSIDVGVIPRGGTSISSAIKEVVKGHEGGLKKNKIMILITDGEDHEGNPIKAALEAKKDGIIIYCIGIGTKEGDLIPVRDETGRMSFMKDRLGNVVKSRLDESTLQRIAIDTGGAYIRSASTDFGLDYIYDDKLKAIERREIETKMKKHYQERFQIPLLVAFILFALEPLINDRKRRKWLI